MAGADRDIRRHFSPLQMGWLAQAVEPLNADSDAAWALDLLAEHEDLDALPIERDGTIVGMVAKSLLLDIVDSRWKQLWQRDLDAYSSSIRRIVEATDYIDRIVTKDLSTVQHEDQGWYVVHYRRSYLGIVNLRTMLEHLNHLRDQDLRRAGEIQRHLLHRELPADPRFGISFFNRMAYEIGGDFYRALSIGPDRWLVACFDVAGKNISGALATSAFGAFFASMKLFAYDGGAKSTTGLLNAMVRDVNPDEVFVSACLFYIDLGKGLVEIHNCGFSPVYAFCSESGGILECEPTQPNMPPLGILDELDFTDTRIIPIKPGLRLAAYSDGLSDMTDPFGERYGDERTMDFLRACHDSAPATLNDRVAKEIDRWIGESHLADDITFVDIRFS